MSEPQKKVSSGTPYFGVEQEKAVVKFIKETDQVKKSKIYDSHLRKPLNTMIESIIRRYKLYSKDMSFEDLHSDTLSFLMTKFDKFDPGENKKAYSYYGTIVKNYLLGNIILNALHKAISNSGPLSKLYSADISLKSAWNLSSMFLRKSKYAIFLN